MSCRSAANLLTTITVYPLANVPGFVNWTGGALNGSFAFDQRRGAPVTVTINNPRELSFQGQLANWATIDWVGSQSIKLTGWTLWVNETGGTFDIQNAQSIVRGAGLAASVQTQLVNSGTLEKTKAGVTTLGLDFTQQTGQFLINAGTVDFTRSAQQTGGTTQLAAAGTLKPSDWYAVSGGTVTGDGTIDGTLNTLPADDLPGASVTVHPALNGAPGILSVLGEYLQGKHTTLVIDVDARGTTSELNVGTLVMLAGALQVNKDENYTPPANTPPRLFLVSGQAGIADNFDTITISNNKWTVGGKDLQFRAVENWVGLPVGDPTLYELEITSAALKVGAITPNLGPLAGGTEVVITGQGFDGATQVNFGGTLAPSFTVVSDTLIEAIAPAEAAGTVDVVVTGPDGSSPPSADDEFTYAAQTGTNLPPIATDVTTSTPYGQPVTIDVLANTSDPGGEPLAVTATTPATNGTVVINPDNSLTYTPNAGFGGNDAFSYTVSDGQGDTASAVVRVAVTNSPPIANPVSAGTNPGVPVVINALANDSDPDGDFLTVTSISQPASGAAVLNADGTITYTPPAGFLGTAAFTYTLSDGQGNSATGSLTVAVATPPPLAQNASVSTHPGAPVTIDVLDNASDPNGLPLTLTGLTAPADGSVVLNPDGTLTYTPNTGFSGSDSFAYTISDGLGTASATVTVQVGNQPPVATDVTATTTPGQPVVVNVLADDYDPDGDTLSVTATSQPLNGSVTINSDDTLTYTPGPGFVGADSFTYTISDGYGGTATATVTLTETPPSVTDSTVTTTPSTPVSLDVLTAASDPAGLPLSVTQLTQPSDGTVTLNPDGTLTYTPGADFTGYDLFSYTVTDSLGGTATATVFVQVGLVANDLTVETPPDQSLVIDPAAGNTDFNGDPLTVTSISQPASGSAVLNADGTVTYTPPAGFLGTDSFSYTLGDGQGDSATATVTVLVANDPPLAYGAVASTGQGTPVTVDVLADAVDPYGDPLTVTAAGAAADGTAVLNPDGTITYTPNPGFVGVDAFSYTVSDGFGSASAEVTVAVGLQPPVANPASATTPQGQPVVLNVLANDSDPQGTALTLAGVTQPANGTATVNADSTITYTPDPGFAGTDSFAYTILDADGLAARATVTVTVPAPPTVLIIDGPVTLDGGSLTGYSAVEVAAGGTLDLEDGALVSAADGVQVDAGGSLVAGSGTIAGDLSSAGAVTAGSLTVTGDYAQSAGILNLGAGMLTVDGSFEEDGGSVQVGSGGMLLADNGFTQTGGDLVLSGGMLSLGTGAFAQGGGILEVAGTSSLYAMTVTLGGTVALEGGSVTAMNSVEILSGGVLIAAGGTLSGDMDGVQLDVGATLTAFSGTISGSLSNSGTLTLGDPTTAGTLAITGGYTQTATGSLDATGGSLTTNSFAEDGGAVLVGSGGTVTASGWTQTGGDLSLSGTGAVNDNGMFQQSGGTTEITGTATLSAYYVSIGGTLTLAGGTIAVGMGTVEVQSGGTLIMDSGTLSSSMGGVQVDGGGTLTAYSGTIAGNLSNFGTVNLGDPTTAGTLAVSGNYTQSMGTLDVYLGGTASGSYSHLSVGGQATFGGTLAVSFSNGFQAAPGNAFTLLSYGSDSGTFATLDLPPLSRGSWDPVYDNVQDTFTLEVTS
jgi:hypothetical protein